MQKVRSRQTQGLTHSQSALHIESHPGFHGLLLFTGVEEEWVGKGGGGRLEHLYRVCQTNKPPDINYTRKRLMRKCAVVRNVRESKIEKYIHDNRAKQKAESPKEHNVPHGIIFLSWSRIFLVFSLPSSFTSLCRVFRMRNRVVKKKIIARFEGLEWPSIILELSSNYLPFSKNFNSVPKF